MNHEYYMRMAIDEAKHAMQKGESPIGAVIVMDGMVIGKGHNRKEELTDPSSHAEIEAIRSACAFRGDWRLYNSTMYVTAEPCVMCAGAIMHARISRVIFGVLEHKFGGVVTHAGVFDIPFNHRVEWLSGVLEGEISDMMKNFFCSIRKSNK